MAIARQRETSNNGVIIMKIRENGRARALGLVLGLVLGLGHVLGPHTLTLMEESSSSSSEMKQTYK